VIFWGFGLKFIFCAKMKGNVLFEGKKNQKPRGVPNSPRTPNGQGRCGATAHRSMVAGCPCTHPFSSELLLRKSKPFGLANLSFRFIGVVGAAHATEATIVGYKSF
jgi:hypothetical protein